MSERDESGEKTQDDRAEERADEADSTVRRAFFAAVVGLAVCPFVAQFWSLWLLLDLYSSGDNVKVTRRGLLRLTLVLDIAVMVAGAFYILSLRFG